MSAAETKSGVIGDEIDNFRDRRWQWHNGVPDHSIADGKLTVRPTPNKDYWCRTFYDPLLVKTDAETFLAWIEAGDEATIATSFTLEPRSQFDQGGIMVLVDEDTWVKAGVEYTDGIPRLSCVVTNEGFSDWSTQEIGSKESTGGSSVSVHVRLSKLNRPGSAQGPCLVFEVGKASGDSTSSAALKWTQIRIASLRSGNKPWGMGLFAICPIENKDCSVVFDRVRLGPKVVPVHHTNAGVE